jgi:SAM-dependent methyltransferase
VTDSRSKADRKGSSKSALAARDSEFASFYAGERGAAYFEYQRRVGEMGGTLNARMFQPYIEADDVVLDFGCGGGDLLRVLRCGRRIGVEPNETARMHCAAAGIECHVSASELHDAEIDVVISNHVLEHVPHPIAALRECRRVLRSSGKLVLCVPIDDWRTQRRFEESDPNHHLHTWTPLLLGNTLSEAGFTFANADIRILTEAWPPRIETLVRVLPPRMLTVSMHAWSALRNRRQILAVATPATGAA